MLGTKKILLTTTALVVLSMGVEMLAAECTYGGGTNGATCTIAAPTGNLDLGNGAGTPTVATISSTVNMGTHTITAYPYVSSATVNTLSVTGGTVTLYNVGGSSDRYNSQGIYLDVTGGTATLGPTTYATPLTVFSAPVNVGSGATLVVPSGSTLSLNAGFMTNSGTVELQVAGSNSGSYATIKSVDGGGIDSGSLTGWVINPTTTLSTTTLTSIISVEGAWDYFSTKPTISCTQSGCNAQLVDVSIDQDKTLFNIILTISGGAWYQSISSQTMSANQKNVIVPLEAITDTTVTTALSNSVTNGNTLQMVDAAAGRAQPSSVVASQVPSATTNVVANRMALVRSDFDSGTDISADLTGVSSGDASKFGILNKGAGWLQPFASHTHQGTKNLISGYKTNTGGIAAGIDTVIRDNTTVGAAISYAETRLTGRDSGNTKNHIDTVQGTLYGSYSIDKQWYTEAMAYYGYNTYKEHSDIPNGIGRRSGKYHGYQLGAKIGAGYKFKYNCFDITPKVSLDYNHLHTNKYTETGAGALNRTINKSNYNVSTADAIVNFAYPFKVKDGGTLIPSVNIGAGYDIKSGSINNTATFAGATANPYNLQGIKPARASVKGGANLTYKFDKTMSVAADYMYEKRSKAFAHSAFLNLRMDF